jgi:hypothetical protein
MLKFFNWFINFFLINNFFFFISILHFNIKNLNSSFCFYFSLIIFKHPFLLFLHSHNHSFLSSFLFDVYIDEIIFIWYVCFVFFFLFFFLKANFFFLFFDISSKSREKKSNFFNFNFFFNTFFCLFSHSISAPCKNVPFLVGYRF